MWNYLSGFVVSRKQQKSQTHLEKAKEIIKAAESEKLDCYCSHCTIREDAIGEFYLAVTEDKNFEAAETLMGILPTKLEFQNIFHSDTDDELGNMMIGTIDFLYTQGLKGWLTVAGFYVDSSLSIYSNPPSVSPSSKQVFELGQSTFLAIDTVMSKRKVSLNNLPEPNQKFQKPGDADAIHPLFITDSTTGYSRVNPEFFKLIKTFNNNTEAIQNPAVLAQCEQLI
jgi:hypothetical protein